MQRIKAKKGTIILFTLALLLAFGYGWGGSHYSKNSVLNRYLSARQSDGDIAAAIKPYVVWADSKEYITMDEGRLASFSPLTDEERQVLKQEILNGQEGDQVFMTNIGTKFWIFPDYRIAYQPLALTLKTNVADMDLLLNDKRVARSDSESYEVTVDRLLPANYTASIKGSKDGKAINISRDYDGVNSLLDLTVTFKTFSVTSNLKDGLLYFGDKQIAQLKEGSYAVEDYPVSDDLEVYVGRKFPDGDLTSKRVAMASIENGAELELDIDNLMTEDEASPKILEIFDSLLYYVSTGQDMIGIGDLFEDGAKNGFYDLIKTSVKSKMHTDSRRASTLAIPSLYLTNFQQTGKESYLVSFAGQYDFYYDKSTDSSKKSQGHLYQNIAGQFTLKKSGDKLIVVNDKNFGLDLVSEDNQIKVPSQPKTVSGLPSGLVGTWELRLAEYKATAYLTIKSNGQAETVLVYDDQERETLTTSIKSHKVIANGLYTLNISGGDGAVALAFIGIGGANVRYEYGIRLSDNQFTTVLWQTGTGDDFDYDVYSEGYTWKKSSGVPKESSSSSSSSEEELGDELGTQTDLSDEIDN